MRSANATSHLRLTFFDFNPRAARRQQEFANALDVEIAEQFYNKLQEKGDVRIGEKEMITGLCADRCTGVSVPHHGLVIAPEFVPGSSKLDAKILESGALTPPLLQNQQQRRQQDQQQQRQQLMQQQQQRQKTPRQRPRETRGGLD